MVDAHSSTETFVSAGMKFMQTRLCTKTAAVTAVVVLLVSYAIFLGMNFAPVAAGADSGGYFNSAKLLTEGRLTTVLRVVPESPAYAGLPLGYLNEPGSLVIKPTYPVGLPMHYAAAAKVLGWYWGPLAIGVLGTLAVVVTTYLCLREFEVSRVLSLAGTASIAISPMLLFSSTVPMADAPATAWCAVATAAALAARRSVKWAVLSGFALSIAVMVRPTSALLAPTLALILWNWRNLLGGVAGGLPGAICVAIYNRFMYGSPFRTGYGSILDAFSWPWVGPSFKNYLATFPSVLPLVFPAVLLLPFLPWRTRWRDLAAAYLWWVGLIVFYSFYDVTWQEWWYLRFVLPAFPLIVVCGILGIERLLQRFRAGRRVEIGVALFLVLWASVASVRCMKERHVLLMKPYQQPYVAVCEWARANLPADALVTCMQTSSAVYFYTDLPIMRWDQISAEDFASMANSLKRTRRPFYGTFFPFEEADAIKRLAPGIWRKIADVKGIAVWKYTPPD